jgi:hypothetical protein
VHKRAGRPDKGGPPDRVLARVLAEDLRRVAAGSGTPEVTEPNPRRDITNGTSDNDGPQ